MGHIYWIASYPKSGNTWMRAFLTSLVAGTEVLGGINRLAELVPDENLGRFYQPFLGKPVAEATLAELAAVRPQVQQGVANASDGFTFLKTHAVLSRHQGTPTISAAATAGAIYIVRNPLDVVVSYARFRNWSIDDAIRVLNTRGRVLPRAPEHSYVPCGSWAENVGSWTRQRHDRLLVLRYEDMLGDPLASFGAVVRLLRMDVAEAQVADAVARTSFDRLQRQERQFGFVERPQGTEAFFRQGSEGQWRGELSEEQVKAVALPNRALMTEMGYWLDEFD